MQKLKAKEFTNFISFPSEDPSETNNDSFYLEDRYHNLFDLFTQKKYRKVLIEMKRLKKIFLNCSKYDKVSSLKIKAIEMIIDRKFKQTKETSNLSSLAKWLTTKENEIEHLFNELLLTPKEKNDQMKLINERPNKIELLITSILKQSLQLGELNLYEGDVIGSIALLAIGENIIRRTADFILSPDSLFVIQEIYLFLSSLNIMNDNFKTAKKYLVILLKLAYKQIELSSDSEIKSVILVNKLKENEIEQLRKIFFNIATALYQLGVCYENERELKKAHQAYKQSYWFANSFLRKSYPELVKLLGNLERRMLLRVHLIHFFQKEIRSCIINKGDLNQKQKPNDTEDLKMKRELINYIEGLKVSDIDDEDAALLNKVGEKPMSEKVNYLTKTVNVLAHLMSGQFKAVVNQMKTMEINRLSNESKTLIKRKINNVKQFQRVKSTRSVTQNYLHSQTDNQNESINIPNKNLPISLSQETKLTLSQNKFCRKGPGINNCNTLRTSGKDNGNYSYQNSQSQSSTRILSTRYTQNQSKFFEKLKYKAKLKEKPKSSFKRKKHQNNNQPEMFSYSKYICNQEFKKKVTVLENQYNRELKFQKQLLQSKTEEKLFFELRLNEQSIEDQCSNFFKSKLTRNISQLTENRNENSEKGYSSNIKRNTNSKHLSLTRQSFYSPFDSSRAEGFNKTKDPNKLYLNNIEQDIVQLRHKTLFLKNQLNKMSKTIPKQKKT